MSTKTVAKLFKEPAQWPLIPPWWLLPSPQAAALLNIKPATLQSWRIRGEGPDPVPPMYLHPTQGDPMYYRYGDIREWAASCLGLSFSFDTQLNGFLKSEDTPMAKSASPLEKSARTFDHVFQMDRKRIQIGLGPLFFAGVGAEATLWEENYLGYLDTYFAKQPRFRNPASKPPFCGPFEFEIDIPTEGLEHLLPT
ncbi:helix-turn-helix domain-containing protein [Roseobacter sp. N2S]|uniref:helix-turn-helix domain-containing protein n=1 Tax=Roseobacter sp. N2S TaxID=2663844 RepID=UPI002859D283|nr:helix-turn-helix domain-containing protein [Roseobacter sp. N2S]MDR6266599.1 hypothetical protein [Roseobacter sp. N2S]